MTETERKIEDIIEMSKRMSRDMERLSDYLETLRERRYNNSVAGFERKMLDIDQALADASAITAFLNVVALKLYSGEYPKDLFEITPISKSEFSLQAMNLITYCRTLSFMLNERSKTARTVYDSRVKDEEKSVK